jgi:hypothetical protein
MLRSLGLAAALAIAAQVIVSPAQASDRTLPMRFDLRLQGPADSCGAKCQVWISASGAIIADTARDFLQFAQGRDLTNAVMVLESDGGSVLGAIALGREIRRLGLTTTVGRVEDIGPSTDRGQRRAALSTRADCESMCAFVLLGGVHRAVPADARVMVHQIWLGDRREDPTAANYSAEDLVLVQRDIGRLAQYTAEMGASVDLLDLALRIPPWEPMHAMTRDELRRSKLTTDELDAPAAAVAAAPAADPQIVPRATNGLANGMRASPINETRWAMVDRAGVTALARHHPLTVEGEDIGSFDLTVACGASGKSYDVSYVEHRRRGDRTALPAGLGAVTLRMGDSAAHLKIVSSERRHAPDELVSYAAGELPAADIGAFASAGSHSLVIDTKSSGTVTTIRLGNTGAGLNLPRLAAACGKGSVDRADLAPRKKTGGLAAAE